MSSDDQQIREIRVHPIENGTVIDHINAGQALNDASSIRLMASMLIMCGSQH